MPTKILIRSEAELHEVLRIQNGMRKVQKHIDALKKFGPTQEEHVVPTLEHAPMQENEAQRLAREKRERKFAKRIGEMPK